MDSHWAGLAFIMATMNFRKFGKTSWDVSEVGFGAWAIGGGWGPQEDQDSTKALHRALDLGVNFIDTAIAYGNGKSEQIIGEVLKERSEEIVVATKIPATGRGPWPPSPHCDPDQRFPEEFLREQVEASLKRLQMEALPILQLHTWTRAWNRDPRPLLTLQKLKEEGKIQAVGISTPEHDQNCAIDLMKAGLIDSLQVIYNLFEQEPAAELLPVARETGTGIIVRVVFDEGVLTGKYTREHEFPKGDFRRNYFAGNRLERAVDRVEKIKEAVEEESRTLPEIALGFALKHPAVSTVITGVRNTQQAEANCAVSDLEPISDELEEKLRPYNWRRAFWYGGL